MMPTSQLAPALNFAPRNAHSIEEEFQVELRVRFLSAHLLVRAERVPFGIGHDI